MVKQRLGDMLVQAGIIDEMQLNAALGQQKRWGGKIGKALVDMEFIDEDTMVKFLSQHLGMKAVNLMKSKITPQAFQALPENIARKYSVVPVVLQGTGNKKTIVLAMSEPSDLGAIDEIQFTTGAKVEPVLATDSAISKVMQSYGHWDPVPHQQQAQIHEMTTPQQLRKESLEDERKKQEKAAKKKQPDADDVEVGPDEDIEVVKGEVTMLKAMKPQQKKAPPQKPAQQGTTRQPQPAPRAKDVVLGGEQRRQEKPAPKKEESPFLVKSVEQEEEALPELEELTPVEETPPPQSPEPEKPAPPAAPPAAPPDLEAPPLFDDEPPAAPAPEVPGPPPVPEAPSAPQAPPVDEAPSIETEDLPPGPDGEQWFTPPSEEEGALSDKKPSAIEIDEDDETPEKMELADTYEFLSPEYHKENLNGDEGSDLELDLEGSTPAAEEGGQEDVGDAAPPPPPEQDEDDFPGPPPMGETPPEEGPAPPSIDDDFMPPPPPAEEKAPAPDNDRTMVQPPQPQNIEAPDVPAPPDLGFPGMEDATPPPPTEEASPPPPPEEEETAPEVPEAPDIWGTGEKEASAKEEAAPPPPEDLWGDGGEGPDEDFWSGGADGPTEEKPEETVESTEPDLPPLPEIGDEATEFAAPGFDQPEEENKEAPAKEKAEGPSLPEPPPLDDLWGEEDAGPPPVPESDETEERDEFESMDMKVAALPFEQPPPGVEAPAEDKEEKPPEPEPPSGPGFAPPDLAGGEEDKEESFLSGPEEETPKEEEDEDKTPAFKVMETESLRDDDEVPEPEEEKTPSPGIDGLQDDEEFGEESEEDVLPWEREGQERKDQSPPPKPGTTEKKDLLESLGDMKRVAAAPDEYPELESTEDELKRLEDIGEGFLDTKEVKQRLMKIAELEKEVKEREYQFDELLNLMMKKELGDITQELFMKELQVLKKKADETREDEE